MPNRHGKRTGNEQERGETANPPPSIVGMGPSGDNRARDIFRHLKVLLPESSSSSHKLRISDKLARRLDGAGGTVLLVSPFGSKVWRVEVGRDGDGAFLGRGWPEFVAAHGIGALWFLVFRHEGGGVLTVKAFDTTCCLREFSRPINAAANPSDTAGGYPRPQFIKVLLRGFMERMIIPPEFVRNHITEAETTSRRTALLSLFGKYRRVEVEKDRSVNVFFSGGWSRFLASNGITQGEALLLRYEGNLVFTVKVFGLDGCQKSFKSTMTSGLQEIRQSDQIAMEEEDAPLSSNGKRKRRNEAPSIAETKRPASSTTPSKKGTAPAAANRTFCTYDIGPQSWIKKKINAYALKQHLSLTPSFCKAIGLLKPCEITLRTTSTGNGAARSWQVHGCPCSWPYPYQLGKGWTSFCRDNGLKEGDICTFNIIETTLWHVDIVHGS